MTNFIANTNLVINHASGSLISGGVFTVTSTPYTSALADGLPVHAIPLAFTFAGGDAPGMVPGSVAGAGTIASSATKVFVGVNIPVILQGDTGSLVAAGTSDSTGVSVSVSGPVEVAFAGQTVSMGS